MTYLIWLYLFIYLIQAEEQQAEDENSEEEDDEQLSNVYTNYE